MMNQEPLETKYAQLEDDSRFEKKRAEEPADPYYDSLVSLNDRPVTKRLLLGNIPIISSLSNLIVSFFCDLGASPIKSLKRIVLLMIIISAYFYYKGTFRSHSYAKESSAVLEAQIDAMKNTRIIGPSTSKSKIITVKGDASN